MKEIHKRNKGVTGRLAILKQNSSRSPSICPTRVPRATTTTAITSDTYFASRT